ncbi:hypothetical protein ACF0H5_018375 [Mactra antiquata]
MEDISRILDDATLDSKLAINTSVSILGNVLIEAAKSTLGVSAINQTPGTKTKRSNRPWFNADCKSARRNFHLNKRIFLSCKSDYNKACMLNSSKQYKKPYQRRLRITNVTKKENQSVDNTERLSCALKRNLTMSCYFT